MNPRSTTHRTFVDLIESLHSADPDRGLVLVDARRRESRKSYRELYRRVAIASAHFAAAGVGRQDRVLVALRNDLESIVAFMALVRIGAVPMSVQSPLLSQDRESHCRRLAHLRAAHDISWMLESPDLDGVGGEGVRIIEVPREGAAAETEPAIDAAVVQPEDTAFVQFSSGSTDHPKGIRITHRNLTYNAELIVRNDGRQLDHCLVSWLPLCHDMGLVGCLLSNLVIPNDVVIMDPMCFIARPATWLQQVSKHRGTTTAIPNFGLDACTDRIKDEHLDAGEVDLSRFRYIYCGSEPVRPESVRRFEDRFGRWGLPTGSVYPVYGMAETTLIISAPDPAEPLVTDRSGEIEIPSVGFPLGDFEVAIRDEGEVFVRGSSVTPGYLRANAHNPSDGWLATGDLGHVDENGRLYITGRRKDLIIHQGRNFFGHDIAERLAEIPEVRSGKVCVLAVPTEDRERIVVVSSPPRGRKHGDGDALMPFAGEIRRVVLREYGLPVDDVLIVKQMPKTTSGKIDRRRCEELYAGARQDGAIDASLVPEHS